MVDNLFKKAVPCHTGYGMTECVSATHISSVYGSKPHSCGGLIPNMECKVRLVCAAASSC